MKDRTETARRMYHIVRHYERLANGAANPDSAPAQAWSKTAIAIRAYMKTQHLLVLVEE